MRASMGLVIAAALAGCLGGGSDEAEVEGTVLSLEWTANPDAVRLVGLFAFPSNLAGLSCESYENGTFDPFVVGEPAGISFFAVQELTAGEQLLDGITTGSRVILVEAYDAGGSRIFLGCSQTVVVDAEKRKEVTIELVPDPSTL